MTEEQMRELLKLLDLHPGRIQRLHDMFEIDGNAQSDAEVIHRGIHWVTDTANFDAIAARYRARHIKGGGTVVDV